jgi:CheY-like chemotaxis protein
MQLTRLGYKVLQAGSAAAALDILGAHERVDLLFTDVIMPGGTNGHTLAREAVVLRPDLKVLYTSGFPRAHLASAGGMTGSGAVLGKPYRLLDLARKVREVLDG